MFSSFTYIRKLKARAQLTVVRTALLQGRKLRCLALRIKVKLCQEHRRLKTNLHMKWVLWNTPQHMAWQKWQTLMALINRVSMLFSQANCQWSRLMTMIGTNSMLAPFIGRATAVKLSLLEQLSLSAKFHPWSNASTNVRSSWVQSSGRKAR